MEIAPERKKIDLEALRELVDHFEGRRKRATERAALLRGRKFYFALVGFRTEVDRFAFGRFGWLEPVTEPPGEVELASAAKAGQIFGAVGRWTNGITHELVLDRELIGDDRKAFNVAWSIVSALRVRTVVPFLVPACADHSWSAISAVTDNSVEVGLIEDYPLARQVGDHTVVKAEDLEWTYNRLPSFIELSGNDAFALAAEALSTYHYSSSPRMMVACLWAGLDAVFGVATETGFRIPLYAASLLEPHGEKRRALFSTMRELYKIRNKAVHGAKVSGKELAQHISAVRGILSRILCRVTEMGKVPSNDELEEMLLV